MNRFATLLFAALLFPFAASAAGNLITVAPSQWKHDFRSAKEFYSLAETDGVTRIERRPGSNFGRIYCDLALTPGNVYRLGYDRMTEAGVLAKQLVIFKGNDNAWREKTRLSQVDPLVNGEWSKAVMTFEVPSDVKETRLDFRLDSYGAVNLKNMTLEELSFQAAEAWRRETAIRPFEPGAAGDYALKAGAYYRVSLRGAPAAGSPEGKLVMIFHSPEKGFLRDGSLTFFCRDPRGKEISEIIVVPDNADGVRVTAENAVIEKLSFTP